MSPRHRALLPWLALVVIYVVWGSTYMAIRVVVQEMPPFAAACLRFLSAGVVMAGLALVADRRHGWPSWRQVGQYSIVGVLLLSVGNALVMWSERRVDSSIAALIVASVPLYLTLFDGLRRGGQRWTARVWAGTVIGLMGVALVARPSGGMKPGHWMAVLALQGATLCWTLGSLYAQSIPTKVPLFTASAIEMIAAGLVLGVESRLAGDDLLAVAHASRHAWLGIGYLVVFGSLVGFTAFAYCLNELPASTVGTYAYVNPVVAVVLGHFLLREPLSAGLLAGGSLILLAVLITTGVLRVASSRAAPAVLPCEEASTV
jgi:drug/metabolite transporter (DMT)-like permease